MDITPISAFTDNYIWIILDATNGFFDCVDPGDAEPVIKFAQKQNLNLRAVFLTHHHHDHIGGVGDLVKSYPKCRVYGPQEPRIPYITDYVIPGQLIKLGLHEFKILFNPGHTSSHISYYEPNKGWLFCGDTLFSAGCGRVFDGTMEQLHQSLQQFKSLPAATQIFCAHEYTLNNLRFAHYVEPNNQDIIRYINQLSAQAHSCTLPSVLAMELLINPFLRTDHMAVQTFALHHGAPNNDSLEVFRILREEKNKFK